MESTSAIDAPATAASWEPKIADLARAKGSALSAVEFQRVVNVVLHDVEAGVYDDAHDEMWSSLELIVAALSSDALNVLPSDRELALTDVGCGTGLATTMFCQAPLGARVRSIACLDTSTEMLTRCKRRAPTWNRPATFHHGMIDTLPSASADLLLTSSVLHHIPDISTFCREIARVLRPGGTFIHMQDPTAGRASNPVLEQRARALTEAEEAAKPIWRSWPRPLRLPFSAWVRVQQWREGSYLREVNRRLRKAGVIQRSMSVQELWSVTDIHVDGLPYAAGGGISRTDLERALHDFSNVSFRSYGFFGKLSSHLPLKLQAEERKLFAHGDQDGAHVAGVWLKAGRA
jgi:ubiquinone/menaquinone biosynthesis C-methylase UbiE